MSHYSEYNAAEMTDKECTVGALIRMGFTREQIEVHEEKSELRNYNGTRSGRSAHVIVRKENLQGLVNDMGFEFRPDGTKAHIDGSGIYGQGFQNNLKYYYGVEKAKKDAKRRGWQTQERKLDNGEIQLVIRR